jgi:hypothetical protein
MEKHGFHKVFLCTSYRVRKMWLNTNITVNIYLFTYNFCRYKWKISFSCCCFLMLQTHSMLAHIYYFPIFIGFFTQVPLYVSKVKKKWGSGYQCVMQVNFRPQYCLSNEGTWYPPTSPASNVGSMKFCSPTQHHHLFYDSRVVWNFSNPDEKQFQHTPFPWHRNV